MHINQDFLTKSVNANTETKQFAQKHLVDILNHLWHKTAVPIYIERFLLAVFATLLIGVCIFNTMSLDLTQRVTLGITIICFAYFLAHSLYKFNEAKNNPVPALEQTNANTTVEPKTTKESETKETKPTPKPSSLRVSFEASKTPYEDEIEINGEKFKVFRVKIEKPLKEVKLNLNLKLLPSNEWNQSPTFPSYSQYMPEWMMQELQGDETGDLTKDLVMQSLKDKQKIYFCVPYTPVKTEFTPNSIWCELTVNSEPNQIAFQGHLNFWLYLDKAYNLQILAHPTPIN